MSFYKSLKIIDFLFVFLENFDIKMEILREMGLTSKNLEIGFGHADIVLTH